VPAPRPGAAPDARRPGRRVGAAARVGPPAGARANGPNAALGTLN
jgi:hypothetical protein